MATTAKKATGASKATRSKVAKVVEGGTGRASRKAGEAAAKVAANAAAVEALKEQAKLEEGKVERLKAASLEAAAAKEAGWKWDKEAKVWAPMDPEEKTPKPPTPNLDALNAGDAGAAPASTSARKATARKAGAPKTPKAERKPLFFLVDGEPVNPVFNNLAGVSRATGRNDGKRLGTKDLRKLLVKEGIEDPDNSVWKHTLPNGVVLSTTRTEPKAKAKKAS